MWKGNEDFGPIHTFETSYGAIYSLAVTTKYIIIGTFETPKCTVHVYDSPQANPLSVSPDVHLTVLLMPGSCWLLF